MTSYSFTQFAYSPDSTSVWRTNVAGERYTDQTNATATLTFTVAEADSTITIISRSPASNRGIVAFSVDGGAETLVDLYAASPAAAEAPAADVWTSGPLSVGTHTVQFRATGTQNAAITGTEWYSVSGARLDTAAVGGGTGGTGVGSLLASSTFDTDLDGWRSDAESGATVTAGSGSLLLRTGSASAYAGGAIAYWSGQTDVADAETRFVQTVPGNNDVRIYTAVQSSGSKANQRLPYFGYVLDQRPGSGSIGLSRMNSGTEVGLQSGTFAWPTAGTPWVTAIRREGVRTRVALWTLSAEKPVDWAVDTWQIDYTEASPYTVAGKAHVLVANGSSSNLRESRLLEANVYSLSGGGGGTGGDTTTAPTVSIAGGTRTLAAYEEVTLTATSNRGFVTWSQDGPPLEVLSSSELTITLRAPALYAGGATTIRATATNTAGATATSSITANTLPHSEFADADNTQPVFVSPTAAFPAPVIVVPDEPTQPEEPEQPTEPEPTYSRTFSVVNSTPTAGWDLAVRTADESITVQTDHVRCEAGGFSAGSHFARALRNLPARDDYFVDCATPAGRFTIRGKFFLPADYYTQSEGFCRWFNTDNFPSVMSGSGETVGAADADEWRVGFGPVSSTTKFPVLMSYHENNQDMNLWQGTEQLPAGQMHDVVVDFTPNTAGQTDGAWTLTINGTQVAQASNVQTIPESVTASERKVTTMFGGIDGAYTQNTKRLRVDLYELQLTHDEVLISLGEVNGVSHTNHPQNLDERQYLAARSGHDVITAGTITALTFGNVYGTNPTPPNPITVRASVEVNGTRYRLVGPSAEVDMVIQPKTYLRATIQGGTSVPATAGQRVYVHMRVNSGSATGKYPVSNWKSATFGERQQATSTDLTMSGLPDDSLYDQMYAPVAIDIDPTVAPAANVAVWGDSIAYGSNRSDGRGFLDMPLTTAGIPHSKFALIGEQGNGITGSTPRRLLFTADTFTHVVWAYGINDFNSGANLATVQSRVLAGRAQAADLGAAFVVTTVTPKATGDVNNPDGMTPNLPSGQESQRLAYNSWLRDGAPLSSSGAVVATGTMTSGTKRAPVWGANGLVSAGANAHPFAAVVDTAAAVTVTNSSGQQVWKAGIATTGDSFHPNGSGHSLMGQVWAKYVEGGLLPFELGVTEPTPSNTGARLSTTRIEYGTNGVFVPTTGATYERVEFRCIVRNDGVSGWTYRDCLFRGGSTAPTIDSALVECQSNTSSGLVEHCTFDPITPSQYWHGLRGRGYTARRNYFRDVVDGCSVNRDQTQSSVLIEGNLIDYLSYFSPCTYQTDNRTHNDGVQILGGSGITIRGNMIRARVSTEVGNGTDPDDPTAPAQNDWAPSTTGHGVLISPTAGVVSNVTIEDNWITYGQQSVTIVPQVPGVGSGIVVSGNRLDTRTNPLINKDGTSTRRALWVASTVTTVAVSGNTDWDGSSPPVWRSGAVSEPQSA